MTLDACVVLRYAIQLVRIKNVAACGTRNMLAARPVAALTTDIPFRDSLGLDVVVNRMAAVASRTGGPLHVIGRIYRPPPIPALGRHSIRTPCVIADVPLRRQRKIVVADLCEITLLPKTAVNQCHLIFCELGYGV